MTDTAELYYMPISHYCVSAERMLAFKGVPTKRVYAAYNDRQELLHRTGQDFVPTLVWKGKAVTWDKIPEFLDRLKPDPPLVPPGQEGLARPSRTGGTKCSRSVSGVRSSLELPRPCGPTPSDGSSRKCRPGREDRGTC